MTKEILLKLQKARNIIKNTKLEKKGWNPHSKFKYFTPDQVDLLVSQVCSEVGIITLCELKKDELGLFQFMQLVDLKNPDDFLTFELRTEFGKITATNETQQLGGTDTYSERYIKMKVFEIKDNNLDPDTDNGKNAEPKGEQKKNLGDKLMTDTQQKMIEGYRDKMDDSTNQAIINGWLKKDHTVNQANAMIKRCKEILKATPKEQPQDELPF